MGKQKHNVQKPARNFVMSIFSAAGRDFKQTSCPAGVQFYFSN